MYIPKPYKYIPIQLYKCIYTQAKKAGIFQTKTKLKLRVYKIKIDLIPG